jgi:glutathione S-transferase
MKLLSSAASPFVRKVRVLILETNQSDAIEIVNVHSSPTGSDPDAALIAANPTGKIPTLVRDDGPALYDSRVICRYLDTRAEAGLYPEGRLWDTLTLEATADAIMDAAVLITYEGRFREEAQRSEDWVNGQWHKIERSLTAISSRWMSHLYGPFDMSHVALGCALGYLDLRHDARNWRKGHDALSVWEATFAKREAMQAKVFTG